MVGTASVLAFLYPTAVPLTDYRVESDGITDTITLWNTGTMGAQPSDASLQATQAGATYQTYISPAAVLQRQRDAASALFNADGSAVYKVTRAEAAVLVDEINILREWIVSFKAAVAASTSLANMQTRVAALPDLPDRTLAQAKTAIQNKLASGVVD